MSENEARLQRALQAMHECFALAASGQINYAYAAKRVESMVAAARAGHEVIPESHPDDFPGGP